MTLVALWINNLRKQAEILSDGILPGLAVHVSTIYLLPVVTVAAWFGILIFYKRYLHPLARFSGPLAASWSNRWLYEVLMTGHAEEVLEKVHDKYSMFLPIPLQYLSERSSLSSLSLHRLLPLMGLTDASASYFRYQGSPDCPQ